MYSSCPCHKRFSLLVVALLLVASPVQTMALLAVVVAEQPGLQEPSAPGQHLQLMEAA